MQHGIVETYQRRPSATHYMARAILPSPGLREGGTLPRIKVRWKTIHIDRHHLRSFIEMTGLSCVRGLSLLHAPETPAASLLYPHVFGFPLQMALLTHRAFPLPAWRALQTRNHMLLHRHYSEFEVLNLETRVAGQRILAKGLEVDLHSTLRALGEPVWEGLVTYYFRGKYGSEQEASALARPSKADWPVLCNWRVPRVTGWRFAGLTGDYNGIHWLNWYARLHDFKAALHHPQLVIGQCLARLSNNASSGQRMDIWLKGPVYYDTVVQMQASAAADDRWFALSMKGKIFPSIVGRWSAAEPGSRLVDDRDIPLPLGTDADAAHATCK